MAPDQASPTSSLVCSSTNVFLAHHSLPGLMAQLLYLLNFHILVLSQQPDSTFLGVNTGPYPWPSTAQRRQASARTISRTSVHVWDEVREK